MNDSSSYYTKIKYVSYKPTLIRLCRRYIITRYLITNNNVTKDFSVGCTTVTYLGTECLPCLEDVAQVRCKFDFQLWLEDGHEQPSSFGPHYYFARPVRKLRVTGKGPGWGYGGKPFFDLAFRPLQKHEVAASRGEKVMTLWGGRVGMYRINVSYCLFFHVDQFLQVFARVDLIWFDLIWFDRGWTRESTRL